MATDIFEFWSVVAPADREHPKDRDVLSRIGGNFDLTCLPAAFWGPLKTALVVLLYLSPGWEEGDPVEANDPDRQQAYFKLRKGSEPLWGTGVCGHEWWKSRVKPFGA